MESHCEWLAFLDDLLILLNMSRNGPLNHVHVQLSLYKDDDF